MNQYRRIRMSLGVALPAILTVGAVTLTPSTEQASVDARRLTRAGLMAMAKPAQADKLGDMIALTLRQASMVGAEASAWQKAGVCLNEPGLNLIKCFSDLFRELQEQQKLAGQQYCARLDLNRMLGGGTYEPDIDPEDFSTKITNPFWPLNPGTTLVYEKKFGGETEVIRVSRLKDTLEINGIECVQVRDVVTVDGEPLEDTIDWYAQHKDGSVWYVGEVAQNFEDGLLDNLDGSWRYGKDGALPGIIMQAKPRVGDVYREEYLANEAEDAARVVALNQTVTVPAGTFKGCVEIEAFTPLEPGVAERKFYAPGVGIVLEVKPTTKERLELVKIEKN